MPSFAELKRIPFPYLFREFNANTPIDDSVSEKPGAAENQSYFDMVDGMADQVRTVTRALVDYVHLNGISNIVFLDRGARPAYLAFRDDWNKQHPQIRRPDVYFVNPKGFLSGEALQERYPKTIYTRLMIEYPKGNDEKFSMEKPPGLRDRPQSDIVSQFSERYQRLIQDREKPLLIWDNCMHTGDSINRVIQVLQVLDFADIRVGVGASNGNEPLIPLSLDVLGSDESAQCYLFGDDRLVKRSFQSVSSERNPREFHSDSMEIRNKLKEIIADL